MLNTTFLLALAAMLIGHLWWRGIPRRIAFETLFISVWIYSVGFFIALEIVDRHKPELIDGLVPYLPPIIPVVTFVCWFLHRAKIVQR